MTLHVNDFGLPDGWEWREGGNAGGWELSDDDAQHCWHPVQTFSWDAFCEKVRESGEDDDPMNFVRFAAEWMIRRQPISAKWLMVAAAGLGTCLAAPASRLDEGESHRREFVAGQICDVLRRGKPDRYLPDLVDQTHGAGTAERLAREWMEARA